MKNFAVIENDRVINVIAADTLAIAKKATGLECLETNGEPWLGWTRIEETWSKPVTPVIEEIVE